MAHEHAHGQESKTDARSWMAIGLLTVLVVVAVLLLSPKPKLTADAPPLPVKAVVTRVIDQGVTDGKYHQKIEAKFVAGPSTGTTTQIDVGNVDLAGPRSLAKVGDSIYVGSNSEAGAPSYFLQEFDRGKGVLALLAVFAVVVLAVSRRRGIRALLGLGFSLLVITGYMMPSIAAGANMTVTVLVGSLLILGPTYLLSYGPTKKSAVSLASTFGAMLIALALAYFFSDALRLTGLSDEDAVNWALANGKDAAFLYSLLIGGTLIGILGVLDDVIIAQVSTVAELAAANPSLRSPELFVRAMRVGNDHIASVVNTLVLAYAGASLPIFLFFTANPQPLGLVVSDESVAVEIVRTFVGTICLVLSVPLATALAAIVFKPGRPHAHYPAERA